MILRTAICLAVVATALFISGCERADTWGGWRGLHLEGRVKDTNPPLEWSQDKNIVWKADIAGSGYSSPVADGGAVYVTTALQNIQAFNQWCVLAISAVASALLAWGGGRTSRDAANLGRGKSPV